MTTIKGDLQMSIPTVKAFLTRNFLRPVKTLHCGGKWGRNVKFVFGTTKRYILAWNDVIWHTDRENRCRGLVLAVGWRKNQKTSQVTWCAFSHIRGAKDGNRIMIKFCTGVEVPNVIIHVLFSSTFKALNLGEKNSSTFKDLQGCVGTVL